jgi:hypothetical protein
MALMAPMALMAQQVFEREFGAFQRPIPERAAPDAARLALVGSQR